MLPASSQLALLNWTPSCAICFQWNPGGGPMKYARARLEL